MNVAVRDGITAALRDHGMLTVVQVAFLVRPRARWAAGWLSLVAEVGRQLAALEAEGAVSGLPAEGAPTIWRLVDWDLESAARLDEIIEGAR